MSFSGKHILTLKKADPLFSNGESDSSGGYMLMMMHLREGECLVYVWMDWDA